MDIYKLLQDVAGLGAELLFLLFIGLIKGVNNKMHIFSSWQSELTWNIGKKHISPFKHIYIYINILNDRYFTAECLLWPTLVSMIYNYISCPSELAVYQQSRIQQIDVTAPDLFLQTHTCLMADNHICQGTNHEYRACINICRIKPTNQAKRG